MISPALKVGLLAALLVLAPGCQSDKKVVKYKPFLANLEGAKTGTRAVGDAGLRHDPTVSPNDESVLENADGSKVLLSRTVRQMMAHLLNTMTDGDDDLLFDQVVSEEAKGEYRVRDKDPREILDYLYEHEKDINKMFNRMPMGEYSPTIVMRKRGKGAYELRLTGQAAKDCRFTRLYVIMEHGNWKFTWIE